MVDVLGNLQLPQRSLCVVLGFLFHVFFHGRNLETTSFDAVVRGVLRVLDTLGHHAHYAVNAGFDHLGFDAKLDVKHAKVCLGGELGDLTILVSDHECFADCEGAGLHGPDAPHFAPELRKRGRFKNRRKLCIIGLNSRCRIEAHQVKFINRGVHVLGHGLKNRRPLRRIVVAKKLYGLFEPKSFLSNSQQRRARVERLSRDVGIVLGRGDSHRSEFENFPAKIRLMVCLQVRGIIDRSRASATTRRTAHRNLPATMEFLIPKRNRNELHRLAAELFGQLQHDFDEAFVFGVGDHASAPGRPSELFQRVERGDVLLRRQRLIRREGVQDEVLGLGGQVLEHRSHQHGGEAFRLAVKHSPRLHPAGQELGQDEVHLVRVHVASGAHGSDQRIVDQLPVSVDFFKT